MTGRPRYYAGLVVMAVGLLVSVASLQYVLHVGSCGNGANSLAIGAPACPGGMGWRILALVAGLLVALVAAARLVPPATSLCVGLGLAMVGMMFAILGFIPAPGDNGTALGLAVGAPFFIGALVAFGFTARSATRA